MFTVIIGERGGGERTEQFDRNEITVGRVSGNDLILARGNVSKHHARISYRDGRFILTDLKSTNGTFVNGRKISQATIVRDGDRLHVGDFVLRVAAVRNTSVRSPGGSMPPRTSLAPQSSSAPPTLNDSISSSTPSPDPSWQRSTDTLMVPSSFRVGNPSLLPISRRSSLAPPAADAERAPGVTERAWRGALAPIASLLDDPSVTHIHCTRFDRLIVVRRGGATVQPGFASEASFVAAIARLADASGAPIAPSDIVIERDIAQGRLTALIVPNAGGGAMSIRKRSCVVETLDGLERAGFMSGPLARQIARIASGSANVLVCGASESTLRVIGAMADAAPEAHASINLFDGIDFAIRSTGEVLRGCGVAGSLARDLVGGAMRLQVARVFVDAGVTGTALATVRAIGGGARGAYVRLVAPNVDIGVRRMAADIAFDSGQGSLDAATALIGSSFDYVIDVPQAAGGEGIRVLEFASATLPLSFRAATFSDEPGAS